MTKNQENLFDSLEKEIDADSVKCENCGSNMVFDPESQTLECRHCGTKLVFGTNEVAKELNLLSGFENSADWSNDKTTVFECDNCSAKVVLEDAETAKNCPFCGTAHVRKIEELAGLKPNALIPFTISEDNALSLSKAWAKKRFFAPRDFKKNLRAENVKGVYSPCFTFDSVTTSYYEGKIGKTHTRTVGSGKNRRTQTYVVWRHISGVYNHSFDDVLITAGSKLNQDKLDKISPFNTGDSKNYEKKYMLGFMAYHYDDSLESCWGKAKNNIDAKIRRGILSNYVHDRVAYLNVSTTHSEVKYKYVMLPIYVGNYNYKKKLYNFYVNGSSGKVYGKTPKSPFKIALTILLSVAVVVGVAFLFMNS